MSRPRVVVTRTIVDEAVSLLRARCELVVNEGGGPMPRDELLRAADGAEGILAMLTDRIDADVLDAAGPGLRVVANHAVGFDNVDVTECTRRGVAVTNTPDVLTEATADLTWALILAARRRVAEGDRLVRSRRPWSWAPTFMLGHEVHGSTLGIVGLGRIGRAVAARARGFSMRVLYHSRTRRPDAERDLGVELRPLQELLREADIVSVHVALVEETRRLIGAEELRSMRRTAVLVNTSRGAVVDERALADALGAGVIAGAALDVYEREPEIEPALLERDDVVLSPHLGSATVETRTAMGLTAARNVLAALDGRRPPDLVNAAVWRER